MSDVHPAIDDDHRAVQRRLSTSSSSDVKDKTDVERAAALTGEDEREAPAMRGVFDKELLRVVLLIGLAALILGWWISATVLKATRSRW